MLGTGVSVRAGVSVHPDFHSNFHDEEDVCSLAIFLTV
jgi:hypothetical protein